MAIRIARVQAWRRPLMRASLPTRAPAPGGNACPTRLAPCRLLPARCLVEIRPLSTSRRRWRGASAVCSAARWRARDSAPAVAAAFPVRTDGSVAVKPVLRTVDISPNGTLRLLPAQAVFLDVAEVGRGRPLLEGLQPRSDAVDPNDLQVLKTSISETFEELAAEICRLDAPRPVRVTTLLYRLNTPPGIADNGALPDLRMLLQIELLAGAPSHEEARQFATIAGVLGVVDNLWNGWNAYGAAPAAAPVPPEQVLEVTLALVLERCWIRSPSCSGSFGRVWRWSASPRRNVSCSVSVPSGRSPSASPSRSCSG